MGAEVAVAMWHGITVRLKSKQGRVIVVERTAG